MKEEKLLLLEVYKSVIRPMADYCSVAYNSLIPNYMADKLERAQRQALRIIFGPGADVGKLVQEGRIETLKTRRDKKCLDFALNTLASSRFGKRWFQLNEIEGRNVRGSTRKKYVEKFTCNERIKITRYTT